MASQRICLDTTFLVDLLRNIPAAVKRATELRDAGSVVKSTPINAFELYVGAKRSESPRRISRTESLLADLQLLTLGKGEAEEAATVLAELMKRGQQIEMRDALIVGCMIRNNCPSILTRDIEHFSRIPKIEVIAY